MTARASDSVIENTLFRSASLIPWAVVSISTLRADFDALRRIRQRDPARALRAVGRFGRDAIALLSGTTELVQFQFRGTGNKQYSVAVLPGSRTQFSRAINRELFIPAPDEFSARWSVLEEAILASGEGLLSNVPCVEVDTIIYSAVIGYAAAVDLFRPGDRGGPGSFFEMVVGPIISLLSGRLEEAAITIPVSETGDVERVTTDLSFRSNTSPVTLVVPTKISTRERISQPYVHQRILEGASGASAHIYRSVLAIANENNTMFPRGLTAAEKTVDNGWTQETLVPATIVLYQKYVAQLSGLYYLDPPKRYLESSVGNFPPTKQFGRLLTQDLATLLTS